MKHISALMFALAVVLVTVASASAVANEKVVTGTEKMVVFAGNSSDGLSDLNIYAFQFDIMGEKQTVINLEYSKSDESGNLIEEYSADYIPIDDNALTVEPHLTSASLHIPELTVKDKDDNQYTVEVDLNWAGGKVMTGAFSGYPRANVYDDGIQIAILSAKEATLTGSIEGEDIDIDAGTFTAYDLDHRYKMSAIAQYLVKFITPKQF